jgi:predicted dehydrogenase
MAYGVLIVTGGMSHQENYALGFQQDKRCRVIGVTDEKNVEARRAALNQKLAAQLGVPHIPDLDDALAQPGVNVVSICTEHHRQGRVALRCAEAGKHIYIDKPMAGSLQEARQLEALVRKKNLRSQMFTQVLMQPAQRVRRLIASGALGEIRAIHHDLHFSKGYARDLALKPRKESAVPTMFLEPDAKREMFNIAVYSLAMFRWLLGRRDFKTVNAVTANYFFEQNLRRDYEDFGVLSLTMAGGVVATISAGRTGWRSHPGGGHNRTKVIGSKGNAFIDGYATRAEITADSQTFWKTPPENPEDPMAFWASSDQRKSGASEWVIPPSTVSDQSAFIDALDKGRDGEVSIADGVKVLEALLGAYQSAAMRDVVDLPMAQMG